MSKSIYTSEAPPNGAILDAIKIANMWWKWKDFSPKDYKLWERAEKNLDKQLNILLGV